MATEVLSNLTNALSQLFDPKLQRQWNREAVLASSLRVVPSRGKNVAWDVAFSGQTAAAFAEGSDVQESEFTTDVDVPATLAHGLYRSAFKVSGTVVDAAASSPGSAQELVDLLEERVLGAASKLIQTINADLYTGTGTSGGNPSIFGLTGSTALSASGTYANIARGTYGEWAGNVYANGGTARPLTFDLLAQAEQGVFTNSGMRPSRLVCSPGVFRKYENLFEPTRRVVGDTASKYGSGTTDLEWRGMPIVRDRNCPSGTIIMLNDDKVELCCLSHRQNKPDGVPEAMTMAPSTNGDEEKPSGVPFQLIPLARTGDAYKWMLVVRPQLKVVRPNAHALIQDISEV